MLIKYRLHVALFSALVWVTTSSRLGMFEEQKFKESGYIFIVKRGHFIRFYLPTIGASESIGVISKPNKTTSLFEGRTKHLYFHNVYLRFSEELK